ncbi:hypothetical protein CTZ27_19040 [Streptomyces griseocarneus]|nr:hypothetical protein CTZ27_19040 [Streptomyces griseocarneus]
MITICNHGAFVLYEDLRNNRGDLWQSKDLYAGECVTFGNNYMTSSTVYMSARDGRNTGGTFKTVFGRDTCFSASGTAGNASYQAAC